MQKNFKYDEEDVNALEHVSMLIDEYMCCDSEKLTESGKQLKELVKRFYRQWKQNVENHALKDDISDELESRLR